MTDIAMAARATASTLARPSRFARAEGRPKTPLPMMQFTVSAARLQRPIARTKPSLEVVSRLVSAIASLYHKSLACWRSTPWVSYNPGQSKV